MMDPEAVERCLEEGRAALVLLSELVIRGERSRTEALVRAQVELDALVALLDSAPPGLHPRIHDLILRYRMMMRPLRN